MKQMSYQQRYRKTDKGKACEKRYRQTIKGKATHDKGNKKYEKTEKGKLVRSLINKRFRVKCPEKIKATNIINHAIRAGKLERVHRQRCIVCRFKRARQYHHPDYTKPLYVFPVCIQCHKTIHN